MTSEQCQTCQGLRSRFVSPDISGTTLGDLILVRKYRDFRTSDDHGCLTCGFILDVLRTFDPSCDDAATLVLRTTHTGHCSVSLTNTCSTIQVYTPEGRSRLSQSSLCETSAMLILFDRCSSSLAGDSKRGSTQCLFWVARSV